MQQALLKSDQQPQGKKRKRDLVQRASKEGSIMHLGPDF
jgi:hypothetical protein